MPRYISEKLGIEYLEIPKAACSSLKLAMLQTDGLAQTVKELDVEVHFKWDPVKRPAPPIRFRFTFVRHPITRFISFYRNKILRGYLAAYPHLPQRNATPLETLIWIQKHLDAATLPDKHVQRQTVIRKRRHQAQPDDFIGKFEKLHDTWIDFQKAFPGLADLQHVNPSQGEVQLSDQEVELVYTIYKEDFDNFGYTLTQW